MFNMLHSTIIAAMRGCLYDFICQRLMVIFGGIQVLVEAAAIGKYLIQALYLHLSLYSGDF